MELFSSKERPQDELGITLLTYQTRAEGIVSKFLSVFGKNITPKTHHGLIDDFDTPYTVRVHDDPPSVQITRHPKGGIWAGVRRVREKLIPFDMPGGGQTINVVREDDITREFLIVTLQDDVIQKILAFDLLRPEQVASLLFDLSKGNPDHFVATKRDLLGIEPEDGKTIPFSGIKIDDEETWQFLENLPASLAA